MWIEQALENKHTWNPKTYKNWAAEPLLWCVVAPVVAVYTPPLSHWLIDGCPVWCKLWFAKAETNMFAAACQALLRVWCGISSGLSVEVATTMATSCRSEWDKTPVRSGHASSRSLLKWEVLLSLSAVPPSFPLYHVFGEGGSLMGLFNCPCKFSISFTLLLVSLPWDEVAYLNSLCVCVWGGCSCKALTPPQRWMVLARHVTHSGVPLTWGHTEQFDVYVRTLECRFHILPDNEIKEVPSEKGIPTIPLPAADLLLRHGELLRSIYAALYSVFCFF